MKVNKIINAIISIVIVSVFSGCAHQLEIKNLDMYKNTSLISLKKQAQVGIVADTRTMEGIIFIKKIADSLQRYNIKATTAVSLNEKKLDYVVKITVNSDYKGSGWNFWINWPGFLIFTPAWHGYNYTIEHNLSVLLTDPKSGAQLDSFYIPIKLDIRHAAINRTWTEIGWLEFGVIPLVGGVFFIQYDNNVTPIAHDMAIPVLADFIAQEIAERLQTLN
jgi:hypothetical protein